MHISQKGQQLKGQLSKRIPIFGITGLALAGLIVGVYEVVQPHVPSPDAIAQPVGARYGDAHPRIVSADFTYTDSQPHEHMYVLTLAGHFHKGRQVARYLSFSALTDKKYAWAVIGYNRPYHAIWIDY